MKTLAELGTTPPFIDFCPPRCCSVREVVLKVAASADDLGAPGAHWACLGIKLSSPLLSSDHFLQVQAAYREPKKRSLQASDVLVVFRGIFFLRKKT